MKKNYGHLIILLTTLTACGGGGSGGGSSDPLTSITVSLSASTNETQVGSTVTLTWSSTNAQTCSATGAWSGARAVSGSEEVTINNEGSNTFALSCSANGATSGSASVQVTGVVNRINITDEIFANRSSDCANYADNYGSNVRDLTRVIDFEGYVDVEVFDTYCNLSSDNIPNHDFNDSSANFRTNVAEIDRVFSVKRDPQMAAEISQINAQAWDAVMLNGVVVDVKSAGCYKPSEPRADADGNTEAGCGPNDEWMLIPLEYSTKFGADIHNAHVQPDGTYHYHGNPNAMFDDSPSGDGSPVIGFAADGFPIYGSYILDEQTGNYRKALSGYTVKQGSRGERTDTNPGGDYTGLYEEDWEWTDSGDLDECNGMEFKGEYGYYITDSYPYIINCFKGEPDSSFNK
jgi:hypothetical protein